MMDTVLYKKTKNDDKFKYVMIYCLLYLSSSFFAPTISGTAILMMELIIVGMGLLYKHVYDVVCFDKKTLICFLFVLSFILIGDFTRGEYVKQAQITTLNFLVGYLASLCFSFDEFAKKFVKVMYFVCICSLALYFAYLVVPGVVESLPKLISSKGAVVYNAFFSTIFKKTQAGIRNPGFFWEPGAFQTFINLAVIFELFCAKKIRVKYLIVFGIALFTTFSTTGYIAGAAIVIAYFCHIISNSKIATSKKAKSLFLIVLVVVVFVVFFINMETDYSDRVFGKLLFYAQEGAGNFENTSASIRFDAMFKPLGQLWEHPLLGIGNTGILLFAYQEGYGMNTCTFVNWFVYFGLFVGAFFVAMFYKIGRCLSGNRFIGLLLFVAFFLITVSENYVKNPSITILAFLVCAWDVKKRIEY